jgi:hypothetical protein
MSFASHRAIKAYEDNIKMDLREIGWGGIGTSEGIF